MVTAWEETLAVKVAVDLPKSFLAQRSRTAAERWAGYPRSPQETEISASEAPRFSKTTARLPSFNCLAQTSESPFLRTRRPCMPRGSWSTAMTSLLVRISLISGDMFFKSFPAISGAARMHQRLKWSGIRRWSCRRCRLRACRDRSNGRGQRKFLSRLATPAIGDVAGGAPEVANVARPEPGLVGAPLAEAEDDGAAGGFQGVAHGGVGCRGVLRAGVAPIVFEIVDAPGGVLQGVLIFMAAAAGALLAGERASIGIDAKFQAFGMDVIGEDLDAVGEILGVDDDVAGSVAADLPAIVDNDVFVAGVLHAARDEGVGRRLDEILGDVAAETVPTVPAHGRSESQTIFQGARRWNAKKNSEEKGQREATCFLHKRVHENLSAYSRFISFEAQRQNSPRAVSKHSAPDKRKNHGRREMLLRSGGCNFCGGVRSVDNDGLFTAFGGGGVDGVQVDAFGREFVQTLRQRARLVGQIVGFRGSFLV